MVMHAQICLDLLQKKMLHPAIQFIVLLEQFNQFFSSIVVALLFVE
jgi:hypothetical protein